MTVTLVHSDSYTVTGRLKLFKGSGCRLRQSVPTLLPVASPSTLQISGPERDVHSGNDGGVFDEPMVDLLKVGSHSRGCATLTDSHSLEALQCSGGAPSCVWSGILLGTGMNNPTVQGGGLL